MTDETTLPDEYADPTKYKLLDGGAIYGYQEGHIVAHIGGKYQITKENTHEMTARRKRNAKLAEMRALAGKAGVNVDDATFDELLKGEGTAYGAMVAYGYDKAMNAKTGREFEGLFSQFRTMLSGDDRGDSKQAGNTYNTVNVITPETVAAAKLYMKILGDVMKAKRAMAEEAGEVIENVDSAPAWLHDPKKLEDG